MRITVGERAVGDGAPCLVIAAVGANHDADLDRAGALIDAAAAAGADAVELPSFAGGTALARRRGWRGAETVRALERLALPPLWHAPLRDRARARGLIFLATAFDAPRASLLAALGVPGFTVASGDLGQQPLLRRLGGCGRPILLSTGPADAAAVAPALAAIAAGSGARRPPVVLLPGLPRDAHGPATAPLQALAALRAATGCLVGWADHAPGHRLALGAVALGAVAVRKPFTDDRGRRGPDHACALEPGELRALVAAIRALEADLGAPIGEGCA